MKISSWRPKFHPSDIRSRIPKTSLEHHVLLVQNKYVDSFALITTPRCPVRLVGLVTPLDRNAGEHLQHILFLTAGRSRPCGLSSSARGSPRCSRNCCTGRSEPRILIRAFVWPMALVQASVQSLLLVIVWPL